MKYVLPLLAFVTCTASAVTVETAALKAEFDEASGSLVRVCGKRVGIPVFTANGGALWEVELEGGVKFTERELLKNGGRVESCRTGDGLSMVWEDANAVVRVYVRPVGDEIEMRPEVTAKSLKLTHLFFPFNMVFDPAKLSRVVVPGNPYKGLGLSLHPEFFMPQPNAAPDKTYLGIGDCYANCHADFMFFEGKGGLMFYGAQPRPKHEPWLCPQPFLRTQWVVHAVGSPVPSGRAVHGYCPYSPPGVAFRMPAVRFAAVGCLEEGLGAYARANGLGKPLSAKAKPDVLRKMLDGPLLYLDGTARQMREALPHIPAPSTIHTADYMLGGFDHQYPDFLPCNARWGSDAELKGLIDDCHAHGMLFCPYTNPTWWCDEPRGPSFLAAGEAPLFVNADGTHRFENYNSAKGWTTCFWHPAVRAANRKTVRSFVRDFPCDLLFQDQVGWRMETLDFNPAAPHPTAYTEGLLSMIEEDCRDAALGCEDGWDKVADVETAMFGNCWRMVPWSLSPPPHQALLKNEIPPHLWEYEAVLPRLTNGRTLYYMHDLGQFVRDERTLAWMVALAFNLSAREPARVFMSDTPQARWYRRLCEVQKDVIAKIAAQPVVSFVHDRRPMLARSDIKPTSPLDDGTVVAQYGATRVLVNLGNVPRTVGGRSLGPYGWAIERITTEEGERK